MHGLTIFEKDDAQGTVVHFNDPCPPANPSIRLMFFAW
jgi:hypothetical protein